MEAELSEAVLEHAQKWTQVFGETTNSAVGGGRVSTWQKYCCRSVLLPSLLPRLLPLCYTQMITYPCYLYIPLMEL